MTVHQSVAEFSCRRVERTGTPAEHCKFVLSYSGRSLSLSGPNTIRSVPITRVDSTVSFSGTGKGLGHNIGGNTDALVTSSLGGVHETLYRQHEQQQHQLAANPHGGGSNFPFIVNLHKEEALVLVFSNAGDVAAVKEGLVTMAGGANRSASVKLIHYEFNTYSDPSFEEFVHFADTKNGLGYIKWFPDTEVGTIPFPHSRLDFLELHMNRSVMQRLSNTLDRSLEFSSGGISMAGHLLEKHYRHKEGAGSGFAGAILPLLDEICGNCYTLNEFGARWPLAVQSSDSKKIGQLLQNQGNLDNFGQVTSSPESQHLQQLQETSAMWYHGQTLIVSNRALFLTEASGRVIVRLDFADIERFILPGQAAGGSGSMDHHGTAGTSVRSALAPGGVGKQGSLISQKELSEFGIFVLSTPGSAYPNVVILKTKFIADIAHRIRQNVESLHQQHQNNLPSNELPARSVDETQLSSADLSTQQDYYPGSPGVAPSRSYAAQSQQGVQSSIDPRQPSPSVAMSEATTNQRYAPSSSQMYPTIDKVSAWTQTSQQQQPSHEERSRSQRREASPEVVSMKEELGDAETPCVYLLRREVTELRDTVNHREVTIRVLQSRCEQLNQEAQVAKELQNSKSLNTPRDSQGSATPRIRSKSPGASSRAGATPRGGSRPTSAVAGKRRSDVPKPSSSSDVDQAEAGDSAATQKMERMNKELEILRHYTGLLEEQIRGEQARRLDARVHKLETELVDLVRPKDLHGVDPESGGNVQFEDQQQADALDRAKATISALRYSLEESQEKEQFLQQRLRRSQQEQRALMEATNASLADMGVKVTTEVQNFVMGYHHEQRVLSEQAKMVVGSGSRNEGHGGVLSPATSWGDFILTVDEIEMKVQAEVQARTTELQKQNQTLVQELREREKEVDSLTAEVLSPQMGTATSQAPLQNLKLLRTSVDELNAKKEALESRARSLGRTVDDLKKARDMLTDDTIPDVEAFVESRNPNSVRHATMDSLRQQVLLLERLQSVPLLAARLATLELLAAERDEAKDEALRRERETRTAHTQLKIAQDQAKHQREIAINFDTQVSGLKEDLRTLRLEAEKVKGTLASVQEEKSTNESKYRKQLKYQTTRISELVKAGKAQPHIVVEVPSNHPAAQNMSVQSGVDDSGVFVGGGVSPQTSDTPRSVSNMSNRHGQQPYVLTPRNGRGQQHATPKNNRGPKKDSAVRDNRLKEVTAALSALNQDHPKWDIDQSIHEADEVRAQVLSPSPTQKRLSALTAENNQLQERLDSQEERFNARLNQVMDSVQSLGHVSAADAQQPRGRSVSSTPSLAVHQITSPTPTEENNFGVVRESDTVLGDYQPDEELRQLQARSASLIAEVEQDRQGDAAVRRVANKAVTQEQHRQYRDSPSTSKFGRRGPSGWSLGGRSASKASQPRSGSVQSHSSSVPASEVSLLAVDDAKRRMTQLRNREPIQ